MRVRSFSWPLRNVGNPSPPAGRPQSLSDIECGSPDTRTSPEHALHLAFDTHRHVVEEEKAVTPLFKQGRQVEQIAADKGSRSTDETAGVTCELTVTAEKFVPSAKLEDQMVFPAPGTVQTLAITASTCPLSDGHIREFAEAIASQKEALAFLKLDLSHCTKWGHLLSFKPIGEALASTRKLEGLDIDLSYSDFLKDGESWTLDEGYETNKLGKSLQTLTELRHLSINIAGNVLPNAGNILGHLPNKEKLMALALSLSHSHVRNFEHIDARFALLQMDSLRHFSLDVSFNEGFEDDGTHTFCNSLMCLYELREVDLNLVGTGTTGKSVGYVAEALKEASHLQQLTIKTDAAGKPFPQLAKDAVQALVARGVTVKID